jgi:hypothetical protein
LMAIANVGPVGARAGPCLLEQAASRLGHLAQVEPRPTSRRIMVESTQEVGVWDITAGRGSGIDKCGVVKCVVENVVVCIRGGSGS